MTEKNLEKKPLATTIKQFNIKAILREKSRKKTLQLQQLSQLNSRKLTFKKIVFVVIKRCFKRQQ